MKGAWTDTIAAVATAPGIAAIAVIRLSGARSFDIINDLFPSKDLKNAASHTLHVGILKSGNVAIDEVVVSLYRGPKSYTGEDVVEISCHGSPYVQEQVLQACIAAGARHAKPGEFTQRAYLNGKMDLTQAEAVADLIASNTEASRKAALNNIRGGFSGKLKELRDRLISFSALIELELDFSQEDVEFADRKQLYQLLDETKRTTEALLESYKLGNVIKNGVQVAIIGKPNAGKSTLLNALLNDNRAIVSEIAGTTRDTIEEVLNIDGILFRLIDTAGIREHTSDVIESIGVQRSIEKMNQADLVIYLFDVNEMTEEELRGITEDFKSRDIRYVLAGNKADIIGEDNALEKFGSIPGIIFLSAKNNDHIDKLKKGLTESVLSGEVNTEDVIITNSRHYSALLQVRQSVIDISAGLDAKIPGDLIALDIRRCLHFLGEITGEVTNDDVLDYVFSKFCIGK
ncbi:tRNA uridine-5-carboxymethylaminomethyl(34) synthesis GTPase MnmE [Pollutibacter soli]|uniref:tRNA uridine-5-carboxymethylaminomethyl(34) synthesis GTPase MnmE n=1 Tax=Pollutibacter soli TaxID=3034157 RepID=UPI003013F70F